MSNEINKPESKGPPALVLVVAIAALTTIELFALSKGINGTLQVTVMCLIAGIAGFSANKILPLKGSKE